MGKSASFKDEFTFEERFMESRDIIAKYPGRVPVIVERYSSADLPEMEKKKFLVPRDMSMGQFIHIISSRLRLSPGRALFVFVNNTLPQTASFTFSKSHGNSLRLLQGQRRVLILVLQQRENLWLIQTLR